MLSTKHFAFAGMAVLAATCILSGCVSDRPSRNGVFNENQYLKKAFLIQPDATKPDVGWFMKQTVVATSTPNPLGNADGAGIYPGAEGGIPSSNLIRFDITSDKLRIVNMRELSADPTDLSQGTRIPEVLNAWPVTNVDLKYRINLDGEKTNFYEENQELDWQVRQWIKVNFAKNDQSDLWAFGGNLNPIITNCTSAIDVSATLLPNSLKVDEDAGYFEYAINLTIPLEWTPANEATCLAALGDAYRNALLNGKVNVTAQILYSFVRADKMVDGSYVPLALAEKDPIRRKYGPIETISQFRDPDTGLLGAQSFVNRWDPNKDFVYYFSKGMPDTYRTFFQTSVAEKTNAVLTASGAKARLKFLNYNDQDTYGDGKGPERNVGDVRYAFISWHSDKELSDTNGLLGVMYENADPRTGQVFNQTANVYEAAYKDTLLQKLELFLQTVGAEFLLPTGEFDDSKYPATCKDGDVVPLVPANVSSQFNRQSTVYNKIQTYLQKPFAQYGYLGLADFLPTHDSDFYNAYFAVLPYQIYADPAMNPYVAPEPSALAASQWDGFAATAAFTALAGQVDHGIVPYDTDGPGAVKAAVDFAGKWQTLSGAVADFKTTKGYARPHAHADDFSLFSYFDLYQHAGRRCIGGKWESRSDYQTNLITGMNKVIAVHEFGHALGLHHNFMGSLDQRNFPLGANNKPMYFSSSVMEYSLYFVESVFEGAPNTPVWGPYDQGALGWVYGNNLNAGAVGPQPTMTKATSSSGQVSATAPWNDPLGFQSDKTTEIPFLACQNKHVKYTPLCRPYDAGTTPAQIMANELEEREWNYLWTNFRLYHKFFSTQNYAAGVASDLTQTRRFTTLWEFDWSPGELLNTLRLIGTPVPAGSTASDYYNQLTNKFNTDASIANQLVAAYHRALIEQSSGERPYITVFDPLYGDVTQQGIQIDKVQATTGLTELWPAVSNFDPSQAAGFYVTSVGGQIGDAAYTAVSQATLADFLGASFATYTYAQLGPIASFAASTHSPKYLGDLRLQTWVGGWAFNRERDFLDYVHSIAVQHQFRNCDEFGNNCQPCTSLDNCTWDPRKPAPTQEELTQSDRYNRFQGPDGRTYIWGYIRSRNQWVLADKDRNIATYTLMLTWLTDVVNGEDDGFNGASPLEYKVRYIVDAFTLYDGQTLNSP